MLCDGCWTDTDNDGVVPEAWVGGKVCACSWLAGTCPSTGVCTGVVAGVWFCCCRCTFCMCHFCEEVWNLVVGLHTTALWTTGTVSLGSRGRCFFTAVVVVELERAGVVVRVR